MKNFAIAVHGGAGTILQSTMTKEKERDYKSALEGALNIGYKILESGGTSLDAVQAAIVSLEDCPLFNAGKGSVFTHKGIHEMDAAVMDGESLKAGAVACVKNIRNPIKLARAVMDHSQHVLLSGDGAEEFARKMNIHTENNRYFYTDLRYRQLMEIRDTGYTALDNTVDKKFGTVGAVALDVHGNLAAATSTGGMTNKKFGRVGDTPIIGSGTYANNKTCAISCTGHGEFFLRAVVAYDVSCLMEYKGMTLHDACELVVNDKLKNIGGEGGLIAVDHSGNIELCYNTDGMYRAMKNSKGDFLVGIYK